MKLAYSTKFGKVIHGKAEEALNSTVFEQYRGKVDLVFTSPPFPLNRKKKYGNLQGQDYIDWLASFATTFRTLLKPRGSIVMEVGNAWEPGRPVMSTLALRALLSFLDNGKFALCQRFIYYNPARLGDTTAHQVTIDVPRIAEHHLTLPHRKTHASAEEHYTIIDIRKLHRQISGRTAGKVKDYLRSLYRVDIREERLILKWNGKALAWDADIDKRLYRPKDGRVAKKTFQFKIGNKRVSGWAGVLAKGSRKEAGFSVIQADRVITGWPDSYRPETLYGPQEGGSNDLVNQRLLGELFFQGFEVSHTKDQILFDGTDQEVLENKLRRKLGGLRQLALSYRKNGDERLRRATDRQRSAALDLLESEIKSNKIQDFVRTYEIPSAGLIRKINESIKNRVVRTFAPDLKARINKLTVSLYLVKDMSENDPYLLIESTESETSVIIIINLAHPHWAELTKDESILNFIRHCTYDGVAEWKAYFQTGKIEPNTVKLIKDNLLRIPMTVDAAPAQD